MKKKRTGEVKARIVAGTDNVLTMIKRKQVPLWLPQSQFCFLVLSIPEKDEMLQ